MNSSLGNKKNDYRQYLDPEFVSKIKSLELKAKLVVEGFKVGLHRSPYHGFSVEFSEHRPYMQGDSVRHIDWKVYGKRDRFYIKQYEEETNLSSHIILDSSASMKFKYTGSISKFEYGKILAAALSYLMISQQDAVGLSLFSEKVNQYLPPKANRVYIKQIIRALENVEASNKTLTGLSLNSVAEKIRKRGMVIIISDLLDDPDEIMKALRQFHYKKNEVIVFQLLDQSELKFDFSKDSQFIDLETDEKLITQPYQIQKAYFEAFQDYLETLKKGCLKYGIDYNLITTEMPFDKALFSYFKKRIRLN